MQGLVAETVMAEAKLSEAQSRSNYAAQFVKDAIARRDESSEKLLKFMESMPTSEVPETKKRGRKPGSKNWVVIPDAE